MEGQRESLYGPSIKEKKIHQITNKQNNNSNKLTINTQIYRKLIFNQNVM